MVDHASGPNKKVLHLRGGSKTHDLAHGKIPLTLQRRVLFLIAKACRPPRDVAGCVQHLALQFDVHVVAGRGRQNVVGKRQLREADRAFLITGMPSSESLDVVVLLVQSYREGRQVGKGLEVVETLQTAGLDTRWKAVLAGVPAACPAGEYFVQSTVEIQQIASQHRLAPIPVTDAGGGVDSRRGLRPIKHGRERRSCNRWYRCH